MNTCLDNHTSTRNFQEESLISVMDVREHFGYLLYGTEDINGLTARLSATEKIQECGLSARDVEKCSELLKGKLSKDGNTIAVKNVSMTFLKLSALFAQKSLFQEGMGSNLHKSYAQKSAGKYGSRQILSQVKVIHAGKVEDILMHKGMSKYQLEKGKQDLNIESRLKRKLREVLRNMSGFTIKMVINRTIDYAI